MLLGASAFRTSITEKAQVDNGLASSGVGLTVVAVGKITGGSVTDAGIITIAGSGASTSVGTTVTVVMTPTWQASGNTVTWVCQGTPSKFVPASCR
jgi:type IV pilus assembly protein PilA